MTENSNALLKKTILLWQNGERKKAGSTVDYLLKQDFTNRKVWQFLQHMVGNSEPFEVFQKTFASRYYPEYCHLLELDSQDMPATVLDNSSSLLLSNGESDNTGRLLLERTKSKIKATAQHIKDEQVPQLATQVNLASQNISQKAKQTWQVTKEQAGPLYQEAQNQVKEKAPGVIAFIVEIAKSTFTVILLALGAVISSLGTLAAALFGAIVRNPFVLYYWVHAIINPIVILSLWGKAEISPELFWGWIIISSLVDHNVRTTMIWFIQQAFRVGAAGLSLGVFGLLFTIFAIYAIGTIVLTISLVILWGYSIYMIFVLTIE